MDGVEYCLKKNYETFKIKIKILKIFLALSSDLSFH